MELTRTEGQIKLQIDTVPTLALLIFGTLYVRGSHTPGGPKKLEQNF